MVNEAKSTIMNMRDIARKIPFARKVWRILRQIYIKFQSRLMTCRSLFSASDVLKVEDNAVRGQEINIEAEGFESYQLAALDQMPDIISPDPAKTISSLPSHVRDVFRSGNQSKSDVHQLTTNNLSELSQPDFEILLAKLALERNLPVDIFAALLTAGNLEHPGYVLNFMHTYWRRLNYFEDVRDLAAMIMRRQFEWSGTGENDPIAVNAAKKFIDDGFAKLPHSLSQSQINEIHDYFISRPGLNQHVPDGCTDQIRRYVNYKAEDYPFCSYPLCDIILAPHLLEAVVNPQIAEIGLRAFGAIPRLWKIFTHWDFPGSKILTDHGTSIGHFHRDFNDIGMMWVYIYLTDVDRESGPHGVVPGSQSVENITKWLQQAQELGVDTKHGNRHLKPEDFFDGYGYQIRHEVKEAMFSDMEVVITGPAGSTFVSNGFNYHRIVSPQSKRRLFCAARYYLTHPKQLESPARDIDKVPFRLVKDRIGDSDLIQEMTRGIIDWDSPRPQKIKRVQKPSGKKYFLVISNGRSGSTLLSTSLGRLSGVRTDFEYRWGLPRGAEGNPIHYVIPHHKETIVESLDSFAGEDNIVGTKLTLSLEWTQRQNVFEKLDYYFDEEVTYCFLTRPYIETLASFLLRGPVHDLAKSEKVIVDNNIMLKQLNEVFKNPEIEQQPYYGTERDIFKALNSLVNNDVIGYGIYKLRPHKIHISYGHIVTDFHKIAQAIGWPGNKAEAQESIDEPLVKKLPDLDCSSFPHSELFQNYSETLYATLNNAIKEDWDVNTLRDFQNETLNNLKNELT